MEINVGFIGGHTPSQQKLLAGVRRFFHTAKNPVGWETWGNCPGILGVRHPIDSHKIKEYPLHGIFYAGSASHEDADALWKIFQGMSIPIVCAAPFAHKGARPPCVLGDDDAAGRAMARHLLDKGFRNFGFYGVEGDSPISTPRQDGFLAELRRHGYTASVHHSPWPTPPQYIDDMLRRFHDWLKKLPKPVGIGACFDSFAMGVVQARHDLRINMPEEMAVVGVGNDVNICEATVPQISSIDPDYMHIGHQAAIMLHTLLKKQPLSCRLVRIPPKGVVERESTAQGLIPDPEVARCVHYMHQHLARAVTSDMLAEHVQLSKRTLQTRFRRAMRQTPGQTLRNMRLDLALTLLHDTDWAVTRIALACGFRSQSHFNIAFKRRQGVSPARYRRRQQCRT